MLSAIINNYHTPTTDLLPTIDLDVDRDGIIKTIGNIALKAIVVIVSVFTLLTLDLGYNVVIRPLISTSKVVLPVAVTVIGAAIFGAIGLAKGIQNLRADNRRVRISNKLNEVALIFGALTLLNQNSIGLNIFLSWNIHSYYEQLVKM